MRIAYFTNTYPRATDTFIRREVLGLRQRGLDVLTVSVRKTGAEHDVDDEVIQEKQNTHYLLPCSPWQLIRCHAKAIANQPKAYLKTLWLGLKTARPGLKGHGLQFIYFCEAILLAEKVEQHRIQHLHNHLGDNSGTVTLLCANFSNISYSISIHGPHIFFDGLHWALDEKTQRSAFIACIGHFCQSQMMLYGQQKNTDKFKIIRCGINPKEFDFEPPSGVAKRLVYVGRLSSEKGVPILMQSLKQLDKQGYKLELTLLGDGEERQALEQTAEAMGLNEKIIFKGFVDQDTIRSTLKNSDMFVLPSFAEGIPVALMEAMAMGVPVISTYVGGIAELITDKQTGQLVFPSDTNGLAKAIAYYIDNPDACEAIAHQARKKIETDFDIDDQVDKLANLFQANSQPAEKNTRTSNDKDHN